MCNGFRFLRSLLHNLEERNVKVKIAVIGATGSAYKRTLPALENSDICRAVAAQARNAELLAKACERFGIGESYASEEQMLARADYDMVFIANPPFMHRESIARAVKTGKPILCEKPLAQNAAEAVACAELLEEYGGGFAVAHHLRHQKAFADIKEILRSGEIGKVESACFRWGFRMNENAKNGLWKLDPALGGGGTLSDNGVHALDMAIALFGKPQKVAGNSAHIRFDTVFDSETAFLAYNGLSVTVSSSQSASPDFNDLVICGDCGRIEARGFFGEKSLRELTVDCGQEKRRTVYNDVNPYALEVEDFARRYVLNSTVEYCGSSLSDSVLAMQIIEEARK